MVHPTEVTVIKGYGAVCFIFGLYFSCSTEILNLRNIPYLGRMPYLGEHNDYIL